METSCRVALVGGDSMTFFCQLKPDIGGPREFAQGPISDATKVVMPDRRTLDQWTEAERAAILWYEFTDNQVDENFKTRGNPLLTLSGFVVTRTFPDQVFKPIEDIRTLQLRRLRSLSGSKMNGFFDHLGKTYSANEERASQVGVMVRRNRSVGYRVLAEDGTMTTMDTNANTTTNSTML